MTSRFVLPKVGRSKCPLSILLLLPFSSSSLSVVASPRGLQWRGSFPAAWTACSARQPSCGEPEHPSETQAFIIIIMYSFMCCFSKLEHTAHYKAEYHWRELPQVSVFSRQTYRQNTSFLSRQKYTCRDKMMSVATKLLSRQAHFCRGKYVSRQIRVCCVKNFFFRDKHNFIATKLLSRQSYFYRDKHV